MHRMKWFLGEKKNGAILLINMDDIEKIKQCWEKGKTVVDKEQLKDYRG